jgi:hypothetical protein
VKERDVDIFGFLGYIIPSNVQSAKAQTGIKNEYYWG